MLKKILFVCIENSARSLMAEALINNLYSEHFKAYSAGLSPDEPDPKAIKALQAFGLKTKSLQSKSLEGLPIEQFDFIITLCDKASKECKKYPDTVKQLAWNFENPKKRKTEKSYESTLTELNERIKLLTLVNSKEEQDFSPLTFYKCFADDTRLRCLLLIQNEGELCVCELTKALNEIQPKISRHLAQLRKSQLLIVRKQLQWAFYKINPELPEWAKSVLEISAKNNQAFIRTNIQRLEAMGDRPERLEVCC